LIGAVAGTNFPKGQDLQYIINEAAAAHQARDPAAARRYLKEKGAPDYAVPALMQLSRKTAFSGAPPGTYPELETFRPGEYADSLAALEGLARARTARLGPLGELGGLYGP
jgi:hypothetical protein